MQFKRYIFLVSLLSIFITGTSQITSFVGARAYPTFGKTGASNSSFSMGYSVGNQISHLPLLV